MSSLENQIQITAIKADLAKKITFAEMDNAQKKEVIDQLFPQGVAFWYADPKTSIGDKVFGWGAANINSGGFFFGEATSVPVTADANINFKFQS